MRAVRAKATTGFISGKHATTGRRVKPSARRAGATISKALQMVGVSQAVRAWRLARSGWLGIFYLRPDGNAAPRFMGNAADPQGLFAPGAFSRSAVSRMIAADGWRTQNELHGQSFR